MDVGRRLRKLRTLLGMSQAAMGRALNVSLRTYQNWEYEQRSMPPTVVELLRVKFGVNPVWLTTGEGPIFLESAEQLPYVDREVLRVPLYGEVAAGEGVRYDQPAPVEGTLDLHRDAVPSHIIEAVAREPERYFALRVRSDSMVPRIEPGDLLLVRREDWEHNKIVVARLGGERHVVKRYVEYPHAAFLVSDNPAYPPIPLDETVEILGRVILVISFRELD